MFLAFYSFYIFSTIQKPPWVRVLFGMARTLNCIPPHSEKICRISLMSKTMDSKSIEEGANPSFCANAERLKYL